MGIAKTVLNWFRKSDKIVDHPKPVIPLGPDSETKSMASNVRMALAGGFTGTQSSNRLEEARHYESVTYIAVTANCKQIHSSTVTAYLDGDQQSKNMSVRKSMRAMYGPSWKSLKALYGHEARETDTLDPSHEMMKLLSKPNPHEPGGMFRFRQGLQFMITGKVYIWNVPNVFGVTCERYVIPTTSVTPVNPTPELPYGGYRVQPNCMRYIPLDDDGYIRGTPALMRVMGMVIDARFVQVVQMPHAIYVDDAQSPSGAGAQWLDQERALNIARTNGVSRGMCPSAVVELPPDCADIDQDTLDRTQRNWNTSYGGPDNVGKVKVVAPGTKVTVMGQTPKDMGYHEGFEDVKNSLLALYGTPPVAANYQQAGAYAAYYASQRQWRYGTIQPICDMFAESDTFHLAPQFGKGITIEMESPTLNDESEINSRIQVDSAAKIITKNEARALRGMPPLPGPEGDKLAGPDSPQKPGDASGDPAGDGPETNGQAKPFPNPPTNPETADVSGDVQPPDSPFKRDETSKEGSRSKSLQAAIEAAEDGDIEYLASKMKSLGFLSEDELKSRMKALVPTFEEPKRRSFGSTQFNLPDDLADRVRAMSMRIADEDLADDGREDDPHVTILYGLTDDNPKSVRQALRGQSTGTIEFGQTSVFKCDDYDVVKIDVLGDYIEHIHDVLADDCKYESTHPTYIPHCTLAYVRSGCGKKYLGMDDMDGQSFMPNKVIFSNTQNTVTAIPLGGVVKDVQGDTKSFNASESRDESGKWTIGVDEHSSVESKNKPFNAGSDITQTLYSGSHQGFDQFNDHSYLTTDKNIAQQYGKHVVAAHVNVKKVFRPDSIREIAEESGVEPLEENRFVFEELDRQKVRDALRDKGYDAVQFQDVAPNSPGDRTHDAVIVFDGKNIQKTRNVSAHKSLGLSTSSGSDGGFTVLPEHDSEIKSQFIPGVSAIGVCPICGADAVVQDESSGEVVCRNGHSFRPIQTLPIGSVTKSWITLKPHGDDEDGYVHVLLGSDGKILAGPKHMEGKKVSELGKTHEQVGEPRDTKHPEQAGQQKTKKADEDTIAAYTNGKKGEEAAAGHEVAQQSHKDAAEFHKQNGNEKQADYHDNIANVHGERAASLRGSESDSSNKPSDKPEPTQSNEQPHPTNAESDQVHLPEGEKPVPESVSAPEPKSPDVPHNDGTVPNMASEKSDETPRQAAERQQKAIDTDYEFARQSAIGNAGVDLKGSARHKRNAWRGLEDAEKDGTAAAFVTRDNLLKAEPHNLIDVAESNPVNALAMHYAMRAFPAKPGYGDEKRRSRVAEDVNKKDRQQYVDTYREYKAKAEELARTSPGPVEALQELKKWVSNKMDDLRGIPQEKRGTFSATYSGTDMYNNTANGLVSTVSAIEASRHAPKNGAVANVDKFLKMAKESYGGDTMPTSDMLSGHVKDVIEGKSVPDTFGKKADGKGSRGFDPTQAYVAHAVRVGGRDVSHLVQDPNKAKDSVVNKFGARGVQWGNSVTEDERKHHAAKLVEALSDLTDVTGIKPQDLALKPRRPNGHQVGDKVVLQNPDDDKKHHGAFGTVVSKNDDGSYMIKRSSDRETHSYNPEHVDAPSLGWAIGARGHGTALAHYEPGNTVVNLTRKSGVGCIAHEWGHAFDHSLGEFKTSLDGGNYMSANASQMKVQRVEGNKLITTDQSHDPMWKGMDGVRKAVKDSGYSKRLKEVVRKMVDDGDMSKEKAKYWLANHEVFARSFEQHVQHKLGTEERQNTYLAGLNGHPLWPTKEESAAMAPAFDGLFQAYREKHYGSPEPHKVTESEMKSLVASVVSKSKRKPKSN